MKMIVIYIRREEVNESFIIKWSPNKNGETYKALSIIEESLK